ncbi:MAG: hypothetical protein HKP55_12650 [Gammaproteobacteria bacterium]|nr:hypothetical protein [Gammaproteobacteria bacterium]
MPPAVGQVYKCRNYDGDISYSEEPCPENETEWGIKITQPQKKRKNTESILSAIYNKEMYATSIETMGRCSGYYFKYTDNFTPDEQALRTSAITALRKISGYYNMSEQEFSQKHNSSMLDTVDVDLGQVELAMMKINCNKQSKQILEFARPELFVRPQE